MCLRKTRSKQAKNTLFDRQRPYTNVCVRVVLLRMNVRNTMSIDRCRKEEMQSSSEGILLENSSSAMTTKEYVFLSKVHLIMENVQQY
jgi:hypothetical protein